MRFSVPIYVHGDKEGNYTLEPLFFQGPIELGSNVDRALLRLGRKLRDVFATLAERIHHDDLVAQTFAPDYDEHVIKMELQLGRRTLRGKVLVVTFRSLGTRVGLTPTVPGMWFDIRPHETVTTRTVDVLTDYFRELGRETDLPEQVGPAGRCWTTVLDIDVDVPAVINLSPPEPFAILGGDAVQSGHVELQRTGRALDADYPEGLGKALGREREVEALQRLMQAPERRPVVLVGPRLVGKTAVIHEFVRQNVERRREDGRVAGRPLSHRLAPPPSPRPQGGRVAEAQYVWQVSPPRLISGMSYVGQWEGRLLAILQYVKDKDQILLIDDLLGLFTTGQSRDSSLSMAQVVKPWLDRGDIRLLAEMTPAAFRVLQEQDRGFADLCTVLPVSEPAAPETVRILLQVIRQLEQRERVKFELDALPTALDLTRRYVRDAAFPGKVASFVHQLAVRYRGTTVARPQVLAAFSARSGLPLQLVDTEMKLERPQVIQALRQHVIGQAHALEALADVVSIAKARLSDTSRPIGSYLFLGPTGVGKTHCAQALARYLFGSEDRLLRFDMNEMVGADAVARLVGTFHQPEGALTRAVRRQPFCVVLLDEIEKAHPTVFNLLLQLMGDARLTDAVGRTVDFSNAILIMTSNLGTAEVGRSLGFRTTAHDADMVYRKAAEQFFPPEFFNRLDRIVPFHHLTLDEVRTICELLLEQFMARDGLVRRRTVLDISAAAMDQLVEAGYHPQYGARALKRVIEKHLTASLAEPLARTTDQGFTLIRVHVENDALRVHPTILHVVRPSAWQAAAMASQDEDLLSRVQLALDSIEQKIDQRAPAGAVSDDDLTPDTLQYFAFREQARRLRVKLERMQRHRVAPPTRRTGSSPQLIRRLPPWPEAPRLLEFPDAIDRMTRWMEASATLKDDPGLAEVLRDLAWLWTLTQSTDPAETVVVATSGPTNTAHQQRWLKDVAGQGEFPIGLRVDPAGDGALLIQGPGAGVFGRLLSGTYLLVHPHAPWSVAWMTSAAVPPAVPPAEVLNRMDRSPGPVIHLELAAVGRGPAIDLRSLFCIVPEPNYVRPMTQVVTAALPLPPEVLPRRPVGRAGPG